MINEKDIKRVAIKLGEISNAEKVILFGSYARGEARKNSDVDFMIIANNNLPRYKRSCKLYSLLKPYPFGMDILVYTPQEIEKGKQSKISFVSRVLREGKTLYVK